MPQPPKNGDHQLSGILGGINTILDTNQIDTEILHHLQGGQHIRRISAEAGQLEHQHIGYAVLAGLDVLHHLIELDSALYGLTGFSGVLVFAHDFIIVEVSKGFHSGLLGIQRISVNLHSGGHPRVDINFYLFFFHGHILSQPCLLSVFCSNSLMESR